MSVTDFPYDLSQPVLEVKLPKELKEISGICLSGDSSLFAIQDENGILYELSAKDGELLGSYPFGNFQDYEGIALVEDTTYILQSNGTLLRLKNLQKSPLVDSFDTALNVENDTEGICYDARTNSLLIACKAKATLANSENQHDRRSIYRFSLSSMQLETTAAYSIDRDALYQYLSNQNAEEAGVTKLLRKLTEQSEELFLGFSDIAIHPISHDLYIPASRGNCLLVLDISGQIKHCIYLSPEQFRQPEGICFSKEGKLYIASEGDGKKAKLFQFDLK